MAHSNRSRKAEGGQSLRVEERNSRSNEWKRLNGFKWIANVEERELQKIPVMGVKFFNTMLTQDGGKVRIGHKVSPGRNLGGQLPIDIPKSFLFC